jgi:hypothetical protein
MVGYIEDISSGSEMIYDTIHTGLFQAPDIALSNAGIHVVWQDIETGTARYRDGQKNTSSFLKDHENRESIQIFPNPSKNYLTIDTAFKDGYFQIFSLEGQRMQESHLNSKINISNLPSGMYILKIYSNDAEMFVRQFMKF